MKNLTTKIIVSLLFVLICSILIGCKTSKKITDSQVKKDSIVYVNKYKTDTIRTEKIVRVTEPVYTEVKIPCDSLKYSSSFDNGKVRYKIIKEKGEVKVIFQKESLTNTYKSEYEKTTQKYDSISKVLKDIKNSSKEVVTQTFWQKLVSNLWFALFVLFFILWLFGVTPKFLISKLKG